MANQKIPTGCSNKESQLAKRKIKLSKEGKVNKKFKSTKESQVQNYSKKLKAMEKIKQEQIGCPK